MEVSVKYPFVRSFITALGAALAISMIACSSDDTSSAASNCDEAANVAKSCSSSSDAGSVTFNFDAAKCKGNDQGEKAAACIVANKTKCDCMLKCSLNGSCS